MKNSKVKNVQSTGMFKELYKYEIVFENGDTGNLYKKQAHPNCEIGDDVHYKINEKGTVKILNDFEKRNGLELTGDRITREKKESKIMEQVCLKVAVEYACCLINNGNMQTIEDILNIKAKLFKDLEPDLFKDVIEKHKREENAEKDLPF